MVKTTSNIVIVILAAGASRRMGRPKQLLPWGDSTLLQHAIHTAQKTVASEIIVVLGANYTIIANDIIDFPITIIKNDSSALGLGKSIACAAAFILKSKKHIDGVLFMLADQPLIESSYLDNLIAEYAVGGNQILATSYINGKKGVPTLFDTSYFKELTTLNDDNGAKSIIKKYHNHVTILDAEIENIDIDSKEDYALLCKHVFKE